MRICPASSGQVARGDAGTETYIMRAVDACELLERTPGVVPSAPMMRRRCPLCLPLLLAVACAGAPRSPCERNAEQPVSGDSLADGLSLRFELKEPVVRAGGDAATSPGALLKGQLFIVNGTNREQTVSVVDYVAFGLDWSIQSNRGESWQVTLYPPPMPPEGGIPAIELTIPPGQEALLSGLGAISGFKRSGDEQWYRALPEGCYSITISGVKLASGETLAPASTVLTVVGDE